jgi:hypothetical protein
MSVERILCKQEKLREMEAREIDQWRCNILSPFEDVIEARIADLSFIGVHNETLSVATMRVSDPDGSPVAIHSCNTIPSPSAFAEVISDDLPISFHAALPRLIE